MITIENGTIWLDGARVGYIPAPKRTEALIELGATGGYRWEGEAIVATPMLKCRSVLVRTLIRLSK